MTARKRKGRPTAPPAEIRGTTIGIRVSDEERAMLEAAAARDQRPLSQWGRLALLAAATPTEPRRR